MDESNTINERPKRDTRKLTDEENQKFDFFVNAPMRSAKRLMEALYKDDSFYETATYAWVGPEDAKKLFLYGVCIEVFKACIALMNDREILQEVPEGEPDQMMKIITGSITDDQTSRTRKLVEILVWLVLFDRRAAKDQEYRIFLSAENLDLALGRQMDFKDLHDGKTISNTQHSIDDFLGRISQDMKELGIDKVWFLDHDHLKQLRPSVFRSKKQLFLEALMVASPDERLGLGISYGRGYSRTSQAVHPTFGSHGYGQKENNVRAIKAAFMYLSIVAMHVMHLAFKLAGIEDPAGIASVMGKDFEGSDATSIIGKLKKEYRVGDLVLTAWTDLAEIIDEHTSKFGYKAYRIRYLSQPPLAEYPEDWLEAQSVLIKLVDKPGARKLLERSAKSSTIDPEAAKYVPEILKQSDEQLFEYTKGFFAELHKARVLIPMLLKSGSLKRTEELD